MVEPIVFQESKEAMEKVVKIRRVTKVTKGGKKMSFSALVVVGNTKGKVGVSLGKANEVADAIRKGISQAKREMRMVPLAGSTIPHEVVGEFGSARVLLKPAVEGTGIIASGPVRAVCEAAGIKDILTKCLTSNNPLNVIMATLEGLKQIASDLDIVFLRRQAMLQDNPERIDLSIPHAAESGIPANPIRPGVSGGSNPGRVDLRVPHNGGSKDKEDVHH